MAQPIILKYPLVDNTLIAPYQTVDVPISGNYFVQLNGDYVGANVNPADTNYPFAPATIASLGRTVTLTSDDTDNSGVTFSIVGEDIYGNQINERSLTGPAATATVQSIYMYHVIYEIFGNAPFTDLSVGTGIGADFGWTPVNIHNTNAQFTLQSNVTGTINYSVNRTAQQLEFPNQQQPVEAFGVALPTPLNVADSDIQSVTVPTSGFNLQVSTTTTDDTAALTLTIIQQGLR